MAETARRGDVGAAMSGLGTMPDAAAVAQMVMVTTGDAPAELRIAAQGRTSVAWRVEVDRPVEGGAYCVLVELPPSAAGEEPRAGGRSQARAAVMSALRERDARCPEVFGTSSSPGVPERLRRWRWVVTSWMRGAPLEAAPGMTAPLARDVGAVLATLHAIPVTGHGLIADAPEGAAADQDTTADQGASVLRGGSDRAELAFTSRWGPDLWPFDGRPLATHPIVRVAPQLALPVSELREQLLAYADQGGRTACHTDLSPGHIWIADGELAGLIDFGDAAVLPPSVDVAVFAATYGWERAGDLLEGYTSNAVLRDIRRAEAYQLAVLTALQKIAKHVSVRPDEAHVQGALEFLQATLPHATRRTDA